MVRRLLYGFVLVLSCTACGHSLSSIPNFDAAAWRADARGCRGTRQQQIKAIEEARDQIYGASSNDVLELLGHPDEEELQEQGQHLYFYYLTPGTQCKDQVSERTPGRLLSLRAGAMGTIIEVLTNAPVPSGS